MRTYGTILSLLVALSLAAGPAMAAPLSAGDILVADQGGTVRRYSASGADLGVFATGVGPPSWITTDTSGNIYVSEYTGGRVDKFSPSGVNLLTITTPFAPGGVRVGGDGTIYVAHYFGGGVQRYSALGTDLGLFASTPGLSRDDFLAFDANGNLYVTDFSSGVIRRISPTGVDLGNFATGISAEGIAFDSSGNLYAALWSMNIIKKYSASGADLGTFTSAGLDQPYGLAFDSAGNLYAANYAGGNIHKFSPSGTDLGIFASAGLVNPRDLVITQVPGPPTVLLLGSGLAWLAGIAWRRHRRK